MVYGLPDSKSFREKRTRDNLSDVNYSLSFVRRNNIRVKSTALVEPSQYVHRIQQDIDGITRAVLDNVIDIEETSGVIPIDVTSGVKFFRVSIDGDATIQINGPPPQRGSDFHLTITFTHESTPNPVVTFPANTNGVPSIDSSPGSIEVLLFSTSDTGVTWTITNAEGILDANTLASLQAGIMSAQEFIDDLIADPIGTLTELSGSIQTAVNEFLDALGITELKEDIEMFFADPLGTLTTLVNDVVVELGLEPVRDFMVGTIQTAQMFFDDPLGTVTTLATDVWNSILETLGLTDIADDIGDIIQTTSDFFADPLGTLTNLAGDVWDSILSILGLTDVAGSVGSAINTAIEFFADPLGTLTNLADDVWTSILEILGLTSIANSVGTVIQTASNFFDDPLGTLTDLATDVWNSILETLGLTNIAGSIGTVIQTASNFFADPLGTLTTLADDVWNSILATLGLTDIADSISGTIRTATEFIADPLGTVSLLGTQITNTLINPALESLENAIEYLRGVVGDLISGGSDALGNLTQSILDFFGLSGNDIIPPAYEDTGGGGLSFPILYNERDWGDLPEFGVSVLPINLADETAPHVHKVRLVGDGVIHFTNLPIANKRTYFQIDITQDGVGGHNVEFDEDFVVSSVNIDKTPNEITTITGYARTETINNQVVKTVALANFGSRTFQPSQNQGTGNVERWSTYDAIDDVNFSGNSASHLGQIVFQPLGGISSLIIPKANGIEIRSGDERTVFLKSSATETLASFSETGIDVINHKISNLANPTNNQDATTMSFVENLISSLGLSNLDDTQISFPIAENSFLKYDEVNEIWFNGQITFDEIIGTITNEQLPDGIPIDKITIADGSIPFSKLAELTAGFIVSTDFIGEIMTSSVSLNSLNLALVDYPVVENTKSVDIRLNELKTLIDNLTTSDLPDDIPFSKLAELAPMSIVSTDEFGVISTQTINIRMLNTALFDYPVVENTKSVHTRLNELQTLIDNLPTSEGGSFDPSSISESLIPENDDDTDTRLGKFDKRWDRIYGVDIFADMIFQNSSSTGLTIGHNGGKLGFFGATPISKPTINFGSNNTPTEINANFVKLRNFLEDIGLADVI